MRPPKPKITKKIPKYDLPYKNTKPFKLCINSDKAPINQYLNYQLSEEINVGIKEVKLLSEEIKFIKRQKKKQVKQREEKEINKNIRIRPPKIKKKVNKSASACHLR